MSTPAPSYVFDTYWKFAGLRQDIFFRKIRQQIPYTTDPVLGKHKFTNAYRASDRVSQYLIKNIIYSGCQDPSETLFRILLFKTFNKIETWELLQHLTGEITLRTYSFEQFDRFLGHASLNGQSIYSGAYIMTSGKSSFGFERKHSNHLKVIESILQGNFLEKLKYSTGMEDVYKLLLQYPTIGPFLAYQYTIDINYSTLTDFSEMEFVVPGPGARDGIRKCFRSLGDYTESDVIKWVADNQESEFERLQIKFKDLWGRPLQLIDCQNLFCEVDKYSRVIHPEINGISGRQRIKQIYRPNNSEISFWYPPKWKLNHLINPL